MKKWNYGYVIDREFDHDMLIKRLENIPRGGNINLVKKTVPAPISCHAAILDFEGNPIFMVGLMIYNSLFSFYIEDYDYKVELYLLLMRILSAFEDLVYFSFSDHEKIEIRKIYQYLECQDIDLSEYIEVDQIPIINLQLGKFESLLESLYSINPEMKMHYFETFD